jgi:hypothetical protein
MRKKLRTCSGEYSKKRTVSLVGHGLQPSAQEVAQWCATSCALFQLIFAKNLFSVGKITSTT